MLRSLYTGLSGVKSHQTKMDVVGHNIANVNTTGFKYGRTTFADILSQNVKGATAPEGAVGGTNPKQVGLGVNVSAIDTIFKDGAPMTTGKNTDLCLSGEGLFVVKRGNETYYTRNGAFEFDKEGNFVLPGSGHFVQGWMADNGEIDTIKAVSDIQVKIGQTMAAEPTTKVDFIQNLSAASPMVATTKVKKTETIWEEVSDIGVLEEEESRYNLKVKIGDNYHFIHYVGNGRDHEEDIDLSKNWTVKSVSGDIVTLVDDNGNTSRLDILTDTSNIKIGDSFSADTSQLRFKSTVNERSPLEFSVDGVNYKAIASDHSVEFPGEGWIVESASNSYIGIAQYLNGKYTGCYVGLTLDQSSGESQIPTVGSALEFSGESLSAPRYRQVTRETEEDVLTVTGGTDTESVPATTTVNVYDSLGGTHQVPVYFFREGVSKDGTADTVEATGKWLVSLENNIAVKKGDTTSYEFVDANGNKGTVTMPVAEIQFDSSGKLITDGDGDVTGNMSITYAAGQAGTEVPAEQDITASFAAVTQFVSSTTVTSNSNGNVEGTLEQVDIDSEGVVTGQYSNGMLRPEAQVAVAYFVNMPGLTKKGTSLYQESSNSGAPIVSEVGDFGISVIPGALEMSNVSVADEFSDMIISQRGFQSNAKIITVSDELLETAVNMKR